MYRIDKINMFDGNSVMPCDIVRHVVDILPPTSRSVFALSCRRGRKALRENLDRIRVPVTGEHRGLSVFLMVFCKIFGVRSRSVKSWRDETVDKARSIYLCSSNNKYVPDEYRDELARYEEQAAVALYLTGDAAVVYDKVSCKPGSASHTCIHTLLSVYWYKTSVAMK